MSKLGTLASLNAGSRVLGAKITLPNLNGPVRRFRR
jgi:hypothetical protein